MGKASQLVRFLYFGLLSKKDCHYMKWLDSLEMFPNSEKVKTGKSFDFEREGLPRKGYGRFHYFPLGIVFLVRTDFLYSEWINSWEKFSRQQIQNIVNLEGFSFLYCQFVTKYCVDSKTRKLFPEPHKKGNFSQMQYLGIKRNIHPWFQE